jgi:hypothetical protein
VGASASAGALFLVSWPYPATRGQPLLKEGSLDDILGEKGHRYKRAVLGFSIVLIVLSLLPNLDYSGLSLFGVKPAPNDVHGKRLVFTALWLVLAYHAIFLALHAYDDWKHWIQGVVVKSALRYACFSDIGPARIHSTTPDSRANILGNIRRPEADSIGP